MDQRFIEKFFVHAIPGCNVKSNRRFFQTEILKNIF